ncbi:hypothetical protein ACLOJK_010109 [Asimina triloba]
MHLSEPEGPEGPGLNMFISFSSTPFLQCSSVVLIHFCLIVIRPPLPSIILPLPSSSIVHCRFPLSSITDDLIIFCLWIAVILDFVIVPSTSASLLSVTIIVVVSLLILSSTFAVAPPLQLRLSADPLMTCKVST